jgi:hypothetical protein
MSKLSKETMFTELSIQLARIEAKLDKLLEQKVVKINPPTIGWKDPFLRDYKQSVQTKSDCLWDNLPPEYRLKPISMSCPCLKCSAYCASGSVVEALNKEYFTQDGKRVTDFGVEE